MRIALTMLLAFTLYGGNATAAEPAEQEQKPEEDISFEKDVRSVDFAIKHYMKLNPGRPLMRNPELRQQMAQAITVAARTHGVPPLLLTTIVYYESTFEVTAKGKLGEIGLTQVHGLAARGCDLTTVEGQLSCGARWLAHYLPKCGTWERALTAYATKGKCVSESTRTKDMISFRMRHWNKMEKETKDILSTDFGG